jgi:hypothetical protein
MDIKEFFESHNGEYLEFDRIENPPCSRPDLCAFLLLEKVVPGSYDIICGAEHDIFWLSVSPEEFCNACSESDLIYLIRCGVFYDDDVDSFAMYV